MASEQYLELLKKKGISSLDCYVPGRHTINACIYAIIISAKDIRPPHGSREDAMLTFYISDPSIEFGSISVCMFQKDMKILDFIKNGDMILVKNFVMKSFNNRPQLSINRFSKFSIFKSNPLTCTYTNFDTTPVDNEVIESLHSYFLEMASRNILNESVTPKVRRYLETDKIDVDEAKFFNYVGEVLGIDAIENRVTLSLTDYTKNPYPIKSNIVESTVEKEYVVHCTVWDELTNECRGLEVGDYICLQNCLKKDSNPMEFSIRVKEDNKKLLSKIESDNPLLTKLIERKSKYVVPIKKKRSHYDAFSLTTEIAQLPRRLTSIKEVNERKTVGRYQVQAYIASYEPENIEDWIKGWCNTCAKPSPAGLSCENCHGHTELYYRSSFIIKDENGDSITVYAHGENALELFANISPESIYNQEPLKNKLQSIISLATKEKNYFEFCFVSGKCKDKFVYKFKNTRFILTNLEE